MTLSCRSKGQVLEAADGSPRPGLSSPPQRERDVLTLVSGRRGPGLADKGIVDIVFIKVASPVKFDPGF